MRIQKWIIKSFGAAALAATFLFSNSAEASRGQIYLKMYGTGFYISARCYTEGGKKSVGNWRTNISWRGSHKCGPPHDSREASYMKIKRKDLWFRNRGSAWRPTRPMECLSKKFCVEVYGSSVGGAYYESSCQTDCDH